MISQLEMQQASMAVARAAWRMMTGFQFQLLRWAQDASMARALPAHGRAQPLTIGSSFESKCEIMKARYSTPSHNVRSSSAYAFGKCHYFDRDLTMMRSALFPKSLFRQSYSCSIPRCYPSRAFHVSPKALVVKPFLLADIGEGKLLH
jgi:hypothetical protein